MECRMTKNSKRSYHTVLYATKQNKLLTSIT